VRQDARRDEVRREEPRRSSQPSRGPHEGEAGAGLGRDATAIALLPEEIELTIDKLVAGGDGFGVYLGIPVFVPRSAPGDRLRVGLVERRSDFVRGVVREVLVPSPSRREPPCPHFGRCGGCDLQHINDDAQVRFKAAAVLETLVRLGRLDPLPPLEVVTSKPLGWRLRTQLRTLANADGSVSVGYHARGTNDLVAVDSCPILVPALEAELASLPADLTPGPGLPSRIDLAAIGDRISVAPPVGQRSARELVATVAGERLAFDARCFFQGHSGMLDRLVEVVVGPWEGDKAVDLYAGVGLFALPLARRYRSVVAVEGDGIASRYARKNASAVANLEAVRQDVESWVNRLQGGIDRLIVDPPRGGLALLVRRRILEARPPRVTYVSCHPAALARDLRELLLGYDIEKLTLLDMFPQTGHMEVVAQLVARAQ
jgi:23S rRNA (uracil1939-C5)-methyltransferase